MTREIKFRGKIAGAYIGNDPQNKWFYGSLVKELSTGKTYILDVAHTDKGEARFNTLGLEVDPNTVGQFTGLLDKNGVEIYEGDKVLINPFELDEPSEATVFYHEKHAVYRAKVDDDLQPVLYAIDTLEVIGNIHD